MEKNNDTKMMTLAMVGAGERGQNSYAPYLKIHNYDLDFVAVAEPDKARRERFITDYKVPRENAFETGEEFFTKEKMADAVLISTQDRQHFEHAKSAIEKGYDILLEKPISPDPKECLELERLAKAAGVTVVVCHVMRYTKFFKKIKRLIEEKAIGDVMSIVHTENVGYWHYAHSYVRGNWNNSETSSPMILAKCCHDMDILTWLVDSRCKTISSLGDLSYFNEANAPEGAPKRCLEGCAHSSNCPYFAPAIYLTDDIGWPTNCLSDDLSYESRKKALMDGPYGRCVFRHDNNVVDHQIANIVFENGVTVAFTMSAFSNECDRVIKIMGTKGEIVASMEGNTVTVNMFGPGIMTGNSDTTSIIPGTTGHSGGDEGIMAAFREVLKGYRSNDNLLEQSVHSHIMAMAAEESRISGKTIDIAEYEKSILA